MDRIQQESPYSCGIAAIQMITALSSDTVESLLGYSPDDINPVNSIPFGMSEIEAVAVLYHLGYTPSLLVAKEYLLDLTKASEIAERIEISVCIPTKQELLRLLHGEVAILCTSDQHMLVWDHDTFLDPAVNPKDEYDICAAIFVQTPMHAPTKIH